MIDDDDFIVDELGANRPKKKRNSGRIGKVGERELAKILTERFPKHTAFTRSIGSGNRWAQVSLSKQSHEMMGGDLVCPNNFNFTLECKFGYDEIDLYQAIAEGNSLLDSFLTQAKESADRADKIPLVFWRKKRKPWMSFFPTTSVTLPERFVSYKGWTGISMENLLKFPDEFFFSQVS